MNNLINFNNLYANLAQSSYEGRPYSFDKRLRTVDEYAIIDYSDSELGIIEKVNGGTTLPNNGILYLHKENI